MQLVSILIPAYNAELWIRTTIRAALEQTWPRKEVIVVDDGSTDGTLAAAQEFASNAVKVISQENQGACSARNRALDAAQGECIQWLDADDLLHPLKISLQMQRRDADGDDSVLYTSEWAHFYFRTHAARFRPDPLWTDLQPVDWFLAKFHFGVWMNPAAWLVSRRLTEMAGPWDPRLSASGDDDGEYLCRLVARSRAVNFVPGARSYYRMANVAGLSWGRSPRALIALCQATELCVDHLLSLEDTERTRKACLEWVQARFCHYFQTDILSRNRMENLARRLGGSLGPPATSRRFRTLTALVGSERASWIKNQVWRLEVLARSNWDRVLSGLVPRSLSSDAEAPEVPRQQHGSGTGPTSQRTEK